MDGKVATKHGVPGRRKRSNVVTCGCAHSNIRYIRISFILFKGTKWNRRCIKMHQLCRKSLQSCWKCHQTGTSAPLVGEVKLKYIFNNNYNIQLLLFKSHSLLNPPPCFWCSVAQRFIYLIRRGTSRHVPTLPCLRQFFLSSKRLTGIPHILIKPSFGASSFELRKSEPAVGILNTEVSFRVK